MNNNDSPTVYLIFLIEVNVSSFVYGAISLDGSSKKVTHPWEMN